MTELVEQNNAVAVSDADFGEVEADQNISSSDITIPKVLIMQGQSPKVLEGEATFGELRDSLNWEKVGCAKIGKKDAEPMNFLPVHWQKFWIIKGNIDGQWKTIGMDIMTRENEGLDPWTSWTNDEGTECKRIYCHMFYGILEGKSIPYNIAFKSSSKKAGDSIVTQMYVINKSLNVKEAWKKSPMAKWIEVTPTKQTKENNTFIVLEAKAGRDATYEEACQALTWNKQIRAGQTKLDDIDEDETVSNYADDNTEF